MSLPAKDKNERNRQILISSPLVKEPVAVRYAWARSPMGNLKVDGIPWQPLHSFRTDQIDFTPEVTHQDPDGKNEEQRGDQGREGRRRDGAENEAGFDDRRMKKLVNLSTAAILFAGSGIASDSAGPADFVLPAQAESLFGNSLLLLP